MGGGNYNSVWATVSSVEKVIKSEISPSNYEILYLLIFISGFLLGITFLIKGRRKLVITPHDRVDGPARGN